MAKQLFGKNNDDVSQRFNTIWTAKGGIGKDCPAAHTAFVAEEFTCLPQEEQAKWSSLAEKGLEVMKKGKDGGFEGPSLLPLEEAQR